MSQGGEGFTLVFYYIPEDLDELAMPNAYAVPKNINDITLMDIEKLFPLSQDQVKRRGQQAAEDEEGPFHFRFKYKYNGVSVWLDLNNKRVKVPKCDGKIIMKVTRRNPKYTMGEDDPSI